MVGPTIREIRCKSLVHRLSYGRGSEYTANFYKGCTHGCTYCYAPSLIHDERRWGTYVDVKVNAPSVIDRELRNLEKAAMFLSSASDPYQPIEAKYRITRRCLERLLAYDFPVSILTRSPLVLRDVDILKKFRWVRVGMSISSASDRMFEPGVPPVERRLAVLRTLRNEGIKTWVSLAPIIPSLILIDLNSLFAELRKAGVQAVLPGLLRFDGYPASRALFEEVAVLSVSRPREEDQRTISDIRAQAQQAGLDITGSSLEWNETMVPASLDEYAALPRTEEVQGPLSGKSTDAVFGCQLETPQGEFTN
jgi:DNA repair photolyase